MDGYGFGIWLVPFQDVFHPDIAHIPHITVMCNMESLDDASKLKKIISEKLGNTFVIDLDGKCELFGVSYASNDPLMATGYFCESDDWSSIKEVVEESGLKGSFSECPHLSYFYAKKTKDLKIKHTLSRPLVCKLERADIRSLESECWKVL